ncbi:MAG: hypothetical protein LBK52_05330 [Deltaproteobacteria bacterium]|jgi:hypothetical protein|nr:hypothetical protein [Deltaproteobacteria bacterium]
MLTFPELERRLLGLIANLDGELWPELLKQVNPPDTSGPAPALHDLAFRDAKALAGYVPDLRALIRRTSPQDLTAADRIAFLNIRGLYNLLARLPVLLLTMPDHLQNTNLIDLHNGFRQILLELDDYAALAAVAAAAAG